MAMNNYTYPTYPSTPVEITATVYQCGEEINWSDQYAEITRTYVGEDNEMIQFALNHKVGSTIAENGLSGIVTACKSTKMESEKTKVQYTVQASYGEASVIDAVWTVTMAQMEVNLYRYCAPPASGGGSVDEENWGDAAKLKAWENEENATLKNAYQYRQYNVETNDNEIYQLSGRTKDIAQLIAAGVEARLVFYPQATYTRVVQDYANIPDFQDRMATLNCIDPWPNTELSGIGQSYYWLKSACDLQQNSDDTWTFTESWIGTPEYLGNWSKNLYGKEDHWNMYPLSGI